MKEEITIAIIGVMMLAAVFFFQPEAMLHSSPMALFLIVILGLLLVFIRFKLPGSTFLFFGGLALVVHPLLFSSSFWLLPGALLSSIAGLLIFIKWWQQNDE